MWNSQSDVLILVLIRLPPKSVGRCKCVSRSWRVLISSSEFIRFHLQYQSSIQKNPCTLLTSVVDYSQLPVSSETYLAEYSINDNTGRGADNNWDNLELSCEIQRLYNPYESHAPGMKSMFVGSCNGLICQTLSRASNTKHQSIYGDYEVTICNPVTKSTWVLPKSPLSLNDDLLRGRSKKQTRLVFYGFGYDDVNDTYKVFLASGPPEHEYRYGPNSRPDARYEYQVYNLSSNKWILVSSDFDFHDYFFHCPIWNLDGVLINFALHWIVRNPFGLNQNKNRNYVLAFDLRVDKLNVLPLPEAVDEYTNMLLTSSSGCLLLSKYSFCFEPEEVVDMWVMKEYGLKDSWTRIRIRNSTYNLCVITPVVFLEDDHYRIRKLIYHDTRSYSYRGMVLLSYDIESEQVAEFPTPPSSENSFHPPKLLQFVRSLVQPHPPSFGDKKRHTGLKETMPPSPRKHLRNCSEGTSKFQFA